MVKIQTSVLDNQMD